jgi:ATP-dependent DNA helicase RecG
VYDIFETEITYLKGVGPKKAQLLNKELGIFKYIDLLYYFPFRYVDKSRIYKVRDVKNDTTYFLLKGKIVNIQSVGDKRTKYITADFVDETGTIQLIWFRGLQWVKKYFVPGKEYKIFGKPSVFKNRYNFVHPEVEETTEEQEKEITGERLEGIYSTTEKLKNAGLGSRGIAKLIKNLLNVVSNDIKETLPLDFQKKYRLIDLKTALINIHFPENTTIIKHAQFRLKFEELFFVQLQLLYQKFYLKQKIKGHSFEKVGKMFHLFYEKYLPFELTNAQKRVIKEIRTDMKTGMQMNRLLQGDVGSGKTLVALMSMLIAIDNGYQTALMAPTEILAMQHYKTITKMLGDMPVKVALLTGSTKAAQRKSLHNELQTGETDILIGTHALIEDAVQFNNLGFVVIDEQHRFGVAQRAQLWKKNMVPPHVLVMTATPIPRTLALTVYGNLDVSKIDELPPGRKPVRTVHLFESKRLRVIGFMREQIKQGRQIYVVYPLIQESENFDLKNLMDGYEAILHDFPEPEYQVSVVHGKMKPEVKEYEMKRFVDGITDIMVSTTVIEVGVDVPNATVMIIENAERFGLSQLHQLRGRVGRGSDQSWCILMSGEKLSNEGRKRLEIMVKTNDGFEIAEADLKMRGPGDIHGTKQSGLLDFKIANLARDGEIISLTNNIARNILNDDPELIKEENSLLRKGLQRMLKKNADWARIS